MLMNRDQAVDIKPKGFLAPAYEKINSHGHTVLGLLLSIRFADANSRATDGL